MATFILLFWFRRWGSDRPLLVKGKEKSQTQWPRITRKREGWRPLCLPACILPEVDRRTSPGHRPGLRYYRTLSTKRKLFQRRPNLVKVHTDPVGGIGDKYEACPYLKRYNCNNNKNSNIDLATLQQKNPILILHDCKKKTPISILQHCKKTQNLILQSCK